MALNLVYFHEIEEGLVAVVGCHSELVFVPVLCEAVFDVRLAHIEALPVNYCALLAEEDTECDVEHGRRVL